MKEKHSKKSQKVTLKKVKKIHGKKKENSWKQNNENPIENCHGNHKILQKNLENS